MARFQIESEEVGPENETLYECFDCSNTDRLVNTTCVPDLTTLELPPSPPGGSTNIVLG